MPTKKSPKKLTRSARLRKCGTVYQRTVGAQAKAKKSPPATRKAAKRAPAKKKPVARRKSPRKPSRKSPPPRRARAKASPKSSPKARKRPMTAYQKFMKVEMKKPQYAHLAPTKKLSAVAASWRKSKASA